MPDLCIPGAFCVSDIKDAVAGIKDAVSGVRDSVVAAGEVASFLSDPFGNTFRALQSGAHALARDVLPALSKAAMPDLTAQWWVSAYGVSFALAVFVMVVLLFPGIISTVRGRSSGQDLFEQFVVYVPLFLAGAIFGPPLGMVLVKFFGALTESIVAWGIGTSADKITAEMQRMLGDGNPAGIAGGAVVGIFFMLLVLIGLGLVVVMLVIQLLTLYFTGVLFPLGWVWIVHRPTRGFGYKIVFVWLGTLASHPLLFLLLGVAYSMMAAQITVFEGAPTLKRLVELIVSALALLVAGTAPFTLLKLAPVLPFGANDDGPSIGGTGAGGGEMWGDRNLTEVTNRIANSTAAPSEPAPAGASAGQSSSSAAAGSGGGGSSGGAAGSDPGDAPRGAKSTTEATNQAANASGGGEAGTAAPAGKAGAAEGAEAGGAAAEAEAGAAAAGTGVGAVAGAAMMAKAAADAAVDAAQGAVEQAGQETESHGGDDTLDQGRGRTT